MCGIAGFTGTFDPQGARQIVCRMLHELERRGPDDGRTAAWENAVIGCRRLAVFDTSIAGRQPMLSPDRTAGVVFNGAIYNYRDLRKELIRAGYGFLTNTDTEVLVHGYAHWGIDRLAIRLEGMFAFCIWDNVLRKVFLVRDRLGVKPLVYTSTGSSLAFASTPRALRSAGLVRNLDPEAILDYLDFGYITHEHCIYSTVVKVPPASIVEWSPQRLHIRKYWFSSTEKLVVETSFEDAVQETERLLLNAVEKRLNADVPVGGLLSGGIDSALICWAAYHLGSKMPVFSLSVPGNSDEAHYAAQTARSLGFHHRVVPLSPATSQPMALVAAFSEPFACSSALGMLQLARSLRGQVKVLLTGDGGDEAFLGYPSQLYYLMAQQLARKLPGPTSAAWRLIRRFIPRWRVLRRGFHLLDYSTGGLAAAIQTQTRLPYYRQNDLLGERLAPCLLNRPQLSWSMESARRLLSDFQRYHLSSRFTGEFLTKVDESTSYESLEARSPFFDQHLLTFAHSLPFETRLYKGRPKAILRELAFRKLGPEVAYRSKRGFTVPTFNLLEARRQSDFERTFKTSILEIDGWLKPGAVLKQLRSGNKQSWSGDHLWFLFILELWLQHEQQGGFDEVELVPEVPTSYTAVRKGKTQAALV